MFLVEKNMQCGADKPTPSKLSGSCRKISPLEHKVQWGRILYLECYVWYKKKRFPKYNGYKFFVWHSIFGLPHRKTQKSCDHAIRHFSQAIVAFYYFFLSLSFFSDKKDHLIQKDSPPLSKSFVPVDHSKFPFFLNAYWSPADYFDCPRVGLFDASDAIYLSLYWLVCRLPIYYALVIILFLKRLTWLTLQGCNPFPLRFRVLTIQRYTSCQSISKVVPHKHNEKEDFFSLSVAE